MTIKGKDRPMSNNKVINLLKKCIGHENRMEKEKITNLQRNLLMQKPKIVPELVVYVPGNPRERYQQELAHHSYGSHHRHQSRRLQSPQIAQNSDLEVDLPPFIPISEDGEEGYIKSQKMLHNCSCDPRREIDQESVRPPPNRTVYDGESPPPYRVQPFQLINKENGKGPTRIVPNNNGQARIVRCYSMSNNNHYNTSSLRSPEECTHSRTSRSVGHSRNCSGSSVNSANPCINDGEPPPEYSDVVNNTDSAVFSSASSSDSI